MVTMLCYGTDDDNVANSIISASHFDVGHIENDNFLVRCFIVTPFHLLACVI